MYKSEVKGKGGIVARVVAHSKSSVNGKEIVTFELDYHRFIHSELMTHRMFSRNAMSSRAVPVKTMIGQVKNSPAIPIHWGKNQSGMQANEECNKRVVTGYYSDCYQGGHTNDAREVAWVKAAKAAAKVAMNFSEAGYHKQIVNRLLEPFQMMKTVVTATELDNFFWLRLDKNAQPEIRELAQCMHEALRQSQPNVLQPGHWHLPYVETVACPPNECVYLLKEGDNVRGVNPEDAKAISAACCAQVSYRKLDNSYEKAMSIYERLGVGSSKLHASPFEHQATPMEVDYHPRWPDGAYEYGSFEGTTHVDRDGNAWSGNFKGWVQHRQLLPNHTCYNYTGEANND